MLTVRDADAARFRTLADLRGKSVATLGGTIAYEILLRAEREHGLRARLVRRRRASLQRSGAGPRRRGAARQRARRAAPADDAGVHHPAADRRDRPLRRRARAANARCATRSTRCCAARCATARSSASSASGTSGTTISRSCTRGCSPARPSRRSSTSAAIGRIRRRGRDVRLGGRAALPAVAASRVGRHARAVVPADGAGRRPRRADRHRARLRRRACCGLPSSATSS